VEGVVQPSAGKPAHRIAAAYDRKQKRKKVAVDGSEPARFGDAIGQVGVVIFSPSDVAIIAGGPASRRRFLDILLSLTEPRYLEDLQRYRQILLQRNALLRRGEPPALVAAWDGGLVRAGCRITAARWRWIADRAAAFSSRVRAIAGGHDAVLEYEPSVPLPDDVVDPDPQLIADYFTGELARVAERERRQATTIVGPHRDDFRVRTTTEGAADTIDLRTFGSAGQHRTAAVALRMIEGETLRDRMDSEPIILMDDVFAELDVGRSRRILEWVEAEENAQVILTAPKATDFELRGGSLEVWKIENGRVSAL
jgi:DNA replication and repair protein RecF